MSRLDAKTRLVPSVLDRLIDPDTETTAWQRGYGPEQMLAAVKRDLEELLNTHQSNQDLPPEWEQLSDSLLTYGVPDLVSVSVSNASEKDASPASSKVSSPVANRGCAMSVLSSTRRTMTCAVCASTSTLSSTPIPRRMWPSSPSSIS